MSPIQVIGLGATGLFAYKAYDSLTQKQVIGVQQAQLRALGTGGPNTPVAAQLAAADEASNTLQGNVILFGALTAAALGATVLLWGHE